MSAQDTPELERELRRHLEGEVHFDRMYRLLYATDASIYQMEPVGVVLPRHRDDVVAVVKTAARYGVAILPRGAGTSLAGQAVNHAIVLDLSKYMCGVVEVLPEERVARVQPGIVVDALNRHVRPHSLQYAPDPTTSNRATVGGGIGNNSCGSHSVIYGKTLDHVKGLEVVLASGDVVHLGLLSAPELERKLALDTPEGHAYREVRRIAHEQRDEIVGRYPKIMRRVSGYNLDSFLDDAPFDLARMVVGSEGTLAVVTEATVGLVPVPRMKALAVVHFQDVIRAMEATMPILEHRPSAVELVDRMVLERTRQSAGFARRLTFVEGDPGALLLVEFYGESESELRGKLEALRQDMERRRLASTTLAMTDPAQQANVWAVRRAGQGLLMSVKGDAKPLAFVEDAAVPPERLPEYVARFQDVLRRHNTEAGFYAHASVGCLHIRPMVDLKTQQGLETLVSISREVSDLVLELGGSLSGEHGDGIVRGVWTEKMFGAALTDAFRQVKRAFDPQGIMNPGKIVDTPPLTENLRIGPTYRAMDLDTHLDFSADGGYAGAAELCSGLGACRKMEGAMCPSYMTTKEEEHTTRARANALRAVLSGALPPTELAGNRLYRVLDLCLECKACKAECPAGVDMAKLKYEFLARYYQANGTPLRAWLFAHIATWGRLGCALAPVSNWAVGNPLSRWAMERLLGIDRRRHLPLCVRPTFQSWSRRHRAEVASPLRGEVVLFDDTFMDYHYPQVGVAATRLLEALGFRVVVVKKGCCGRPMISKGLLKRARDNAQHNVDLLYPYATRGVPIVGCEPSCLLTLRDEYPDLLHDDKARVVASQALMMEELLMKVAGEQNMAQVFRETPRDILYHAHCHQRALVGAEPAIQALRLVPGHRVELVDAGCCGLAGAFGYEREHYDVSYAVGAQRLFPALQAPEKAGCTVAVSGASCRQQVEHFTGRRARHWVELLADALAE
ncbi:MAG: FAD-binding protein [Chloroflexi bacterium]|nr:FAD-binding protein [Chloroflexota bacterium]